MAILAIVAKYFLGTFIEKFLNAAFAMFQESFDDAAREELGATRTAADSSAETIRVKGKVDAETSRETDIDEVVADLAAGRF